MQLNSKIVSLLLLSTLLSVGLLITRIIISATVTFDFMLWNLVLAWIPFLLSSSMLWYAHHKHKRRPILMILFLLWLLFYPNAAYLLTDSIHLTRRDTTPIWFDSLLLQSFAMTGLFLGAASLLHIQIWMETVVNEQRAKYLSVSLLFLTSVGVALGRFFRWNSWEVFTAPQNLLQNFSSSSTTRFVEAAGFTVVFFLFLLVAYELLFMIHSHKHK